MIPRPVQFLIILILLASMACITVNVPIGGDPTSAATVWTVDPEHRESWNVSSNYIIQVKDFSASPSLQRVEMIVLAENGTLNRASTDVWSSRPMELLPDLLVRDMVDSGAWGAVLRKATMLREDLIVEGYVREFGGRIVEGGWEAVIDIDVTVLNGYSFDLIFQKNYNFHWVLSESSYSELAEAMSILIAIWSEEVTEDIWSSMLPIR
ncbi:MAG: membrane integrity-associated transporter subunit PqiC [Candidatus Fermentibacteraceae bacterium]|nr:membrane integrity-associated transporter subunit PqiC [Candidatus Fermentibacteraceae bacterium]